MTKVVASWQRVGQIILSDLKMEIKQTFSNLKSDEVRHFYKRIV